MNVHSYIGQNSDLYTVICLFVNMSVMSVGVFKCQKKFELIREHLK